MPASHPTVLLRHDLPDGSHHFDWMLARDDDGPLLTFRLDRDISRDGEPFEGELLPDHRRAYLEYEGPISGNRGSVARVAQGRCEVKQEGAERVLIWLELGHRVGELGGIHQGQGRFLFGAPENGLRISQDFG